MIWDSLYSLHSCLFIRQRFDIGRFFFQSFITTLIFLLYVGLTPFHALANNEIDSDSILNNAPNLSKLLDHSVRPSMDEVYSAAKADGLLNNKALIAKFKSKNEETINTMAELFINLESLYPGFQLFTLGRDAVAYSDLFDAIAIHLEKPQRAVRVNLSGESARHADPELLRQYLFSLGIPKSKSELFKNNPIVFMDYTRYDSTSQLRRLTDIVLSSLDLSEKEKAKVRTKFAALTTSGRHSPINEQIIRHIGSYGEAIWSIDDKIRRATTFNGKFDSLVQQNNGHFVTKPGSIEAPSLYEKKDSLIEMLGYLLIGKEIIKITRILLQSESQLIQLDNELNSSNNENLPIKYFRIARDIIRSKNEFYIINLMNIISKSKMTKSKLALQKHINRIVAHDITIEMSQYIIYDVETTDYIGLIKSKIKECFRHRNYLARYFFSQPYSQFMSDQLKVIIENADRNTLYTVARYTFSQPHTQHMTDLLELVIEKNDQSSLQALATHAFSQPHTQNMTDLLKLVIEKADHVTLYYLSKFTFSQPHTQHMTDARWALVQRAKSLNYTDSEIQKIEQELTSITNSCEARLDI